MSHHPPDDVLRDLLPRVVADCPAHPADPVPELRMFPPRYLPTFRTLRRSLLRLRPVLTANRLSVLIELLPVMTPAPRWPPPPLPGLGHCRRRASGNAHRLLRSLVYPRRNAGCVQARDSGGEKRQMPRAGRPVRQPGDPVEGGYNLSRWKTGCA